MQGLSVLLNKSARLKCFWPVWRWSVQSSIQLSGRLPAHTSPERTHLLRSYQEANWL